MIEERDRRAWGYAAVGVVGGLLLEFAPILFFSLAHRHAAGFNPTIILVMTASVLCAMIWAEYFAVSAHRTLDEFRREGAKFAWYWGGLMGAFASAPLYAFIGLGGLHWLFPASPIGPQLLRAFVVGYCILLFPQTIGFLVVHLWWKRSRR